MEHSLVSDKGRFFLSKLKSDKRSRQEAVDWLIFQKHPVADEMTIEKLKNVYGLTEEEYLNWLKSVAEGSCCG